MTGLVVRALYYISSSFFWKLRTFHIGLPSESLTTTLLYGARLLLTSNLALRMRRFTDFTLLAALYAGCCHVGQQRSPSPFLSVLGHPLHTPPAKAFCLQFGFHCAPPGVSWSSLLPSAFRGSSVEPF